MNQAAIMARSSLSRRSVGELQHSASKKVTLMAAGLTPVKPFAGATLLCFCAEHTHRADDYIHSLRAAPCLRKAFSDEE